MFVFEVCNLSGLFMMLKFDFVYIDYCYKEIDNGEMVIIFCNCGYEVCIEVCYCKIGLFEGVIGV